MTLYVIAGRWLGFKGTLTKFFIVYWAKYFGLLFHVLWSGFYFQNKYMEHDELDSLFAHTQPWLASFLEYSTWKVGASAIRWIDPEWEHQADSLAPF